MFSMTAPLRACWPPPPHDPRERVVLTRADDWQVRSFLLTDPKFEYFAPRGLWHLQLWHPEAGISILTPSGLTLDRYEVFPIGEWKWRVKSHEELVSLLDGVHGVQPPSAGTLHNLESFFVHDPVRDFFAARGGVVAARALTARERTV